MNHYGLDIGLDHGNAGNVGWLDRSTSRPNSELWYATFPHRPRRRSADWKVETWHTRRRRLTDSWSDLTGRMFQKDTAPVGMINPTEAQIIEKTQHKILLAWTVVDQ